MYSAIFASWGKITNFTVSATVNKLQLSWPILPLGNKIIFPRTCACFKNVNINSRGNLYFCSTWALWWHYSSTTMHLALPVQKTCACIANVACPWFQLGVINKFVHILFLPPCRIPGNKWALDMAKLNLVTNYLVVGLTEELGDFIAVMEATLPRFFSGATELFEAGKGRAGLYQYFI